MLADVTSTATMSLNDSHGDILAAIRDSLNNQVAIELTVEYPPEQSLQKPSLRGRLFSVAAADSTCIGACAVIE